MYGQMTAGSWIYIGTQGILQGTFETFAAVARKRFDGSLRGRLVLTAGCGGMGGAQPLAVTMLDGVCLVVDVDAAPPRAPRRAALPRSRRARPRGGPARGRGGARGRATGARSASSARRGEVFRALLERGVVPDIVTDQTSAHDPLGGYVPDGLSLADAAELRESDPRALHRALARLDGRALRRDGRRSRSAAPRSSTTATACAPRLARAASSRPSPTPASSGLRAAAVLHAARARSAGRRSRAIPTTSPRPTPPWASSSPRTQHLQRWLELARTRIAYQGLPARICWLGLRRAPPRGPALQRARALGRGQRADRDRPRPPRLGLRRLALPRDRGDDGRLGRDRRLADPQRAARRLLGRRVGRRPPRRRRRHRALDPLGRAGRRRRHRRGRAARSSACSRTTRARA